MPRRIGFVGKPEDWLRRAKGNLARAKQTKPKDAFWEDLCFDAQQAAEKAIKAVLVFRQLEFRKTHDLRGLLTLLDSSGYPIPEEIRKADELTDYAVETRYPGLSEPGWCDGIPRCHCTGGSRGTLGGRTDHAAEEA
jgi:HEPN domain-containing protein